MNLGKKLLVASAFAIASILPAQADVVLDSFEYTYFSGPDAGDATGQITMNTTGSTFPNTVGNLASIIGAYTEYSFFPSSTNDVNPVATTGDGQLQVSFGNGLPDPYYLSVTYYGGPGGQDFASMGSTLAVWVDELDLNTVSSGFTVTATLTDSSSEQVQIQLPVNFVVVAGSPQLILVPFSGFSAITAGTFNWGEVEFANMLFTAANGNVDFTLSAIGIVPEPATLGVLGLGLIGLGLRRRKSAK